MKEIALEIIRQLGGTAALTALVGAKHFSYKENEKGETVVSFKIAASRVVNYIQITLDGMDEYIVTLSKLYGNELKLVKEYKGVCVDNILDVLEEGCQCYFTLHKRV